MTSVTIKSNTYTYTSPFAGITEVVDHALRQLTPAAGALWRELRRSTVAGGEFEFNLETLAEKLGYTPRWLRSALTELMTAELVVLQRRSWGRWFRVQVNDPGIVQESSCERRKTSINCSKSSLKQPSNADSLVTQDPKLFKSKTETVPTHHPVFENEQEGADRLGTTSTQQDDPNPQTKQILAEVRDAGIRLNPTIQRVIAETVAQLGAAAMERIRNAAAVVSHSKQARNPEGLFMKAIKLGWQPRRSPQDSPQNPPSVTGEPEPLPAADPSRSPLPAQAQTPPGFKEWFDLAHSIGLVKYSTYDPRATGHDEHCVFVRDGWIPTSQAMKLHPVSELQEIANRR